MCAVQVDLGVTYRRAEAQTSITGKMMEREAQGFSESGSDVGASLGSSGSAQGHLCRGAGEWGTRRTRPPSDLRCAGA